MISGLLITEPTAVLSFPLTALEATFPFASAYEGCAICASVGVGTEYSILGAVSTVPFPGFKLSLVWFANSLIVKFDPKSTLPIYLVQLVATVL